MTQWQRQRTRSAKSADRRKRNNAARVAHLAEVIAAQREKVGLITYKATKAEIAEQLPENVITGHFNDTRGRNLGEVVDALILAGRTLPSEREAEKLAEAIHYQSEVEIRPEQ